MGLSKSAKRVRLNADVIGLLVLGLRDAARTDAVQLCFRETRLRIVHTTRRNAPLAPWPRTAAEAAGVEEPSWTLQPIPEVTVVYPLDHRAGLRPRTPLGVRMVRRIPQG